MLVLVRKLSAATAIPTLAQIPETTLRQMRQVRFGANDARPWNFEPYDAPGEPIVTYPSDAELDRLDRLERGALPGPWNSLEFAAHPVLSVYRANIAVLQESRNALPSLLAAARDRNRLAAEVESKEDQRLDAESRAQENAYFCQLAHDMEYELSAVVSVPGTPLLIDVAKAARAKIEGLAAEVERLTEECAEWQQRCARQTKTLLKKTWPDDRPIKGTLRDDFFPPSGLEGISGV